MNKIIATTLMSLAMMSPVLAQTSSVSNHHISIPNPQPTVSYKKIKPSILPNAEATANAGMSPSTNPIPIL